MLHKTTANAEMTIDGIVRNIAYIKYRLLQPFLPHGGLNFDSLEEEEQRKKLMESAETIFANIQPRGDTDIHFIGLRAGFSKLINILQNSNIQNQLCLLLLYRWTAQINKDLKNFLNYDYEQDPENSTRFFLCLAEILNLVLIKLENNDAMGVITLLEIIVSKHPLATSLINTAVEFRNEIMRVDGLVKKTSNEIAEQQKLFADTSEKLDTLLAEIVQKRQTLEIEAALRDSQSDLAESDVSRAQLRLRQTPAVLTPVAQKEKAVEVAPKSPSTELKIHHPVEFEITALSEALNQLENLKNFLYEILKAYAFNQTSREILNGKFPLRADFNRLAQFEQVEAEHCLPEILAKNTVFMTASMIYFNRIIPLINNYQKQLEHKQNPEIVFPKGLEFNFKELSQECIQKLDLTRTQKFLADVCASLELIDPIATATFTPTPRERKNSVTPASALAPAPDLVPAASAKALAARANTAARATAASRTTTKTAVALPRTLTRNT